MTASAHFLPDEERPEGFEYPRDYREFVARRSHGLAVLELPPWVFASDEKWAMEKSEALFGKKLVPFAQAENLDMIAFFAVGGGDQPEVWVTNPWDGVIFEKLGDFSRWVDYASTLSRELLRERPYFKEKSFWFPLAGHPSRDD